MRAAQPRPVAAVCAQTLPFVTPGLRVTFAGAAGGGSTFAYETTSDKRLAIRGQVTPPPAGGRVTLRREDVAPQPRVTAIAPGGRFAFDGIRLRKVASNAFTMTIDAPPNAPRRIHFSAICLDCLAGATPESVRR